MNNEQNKALVRRAVEGIWNKGDLALVEEITAADYVGHMPGGQEVRGIAGIKAAIASFRVAFPNVHMHIVSQVAEGDEVVTTLTMKGNQQGPLPVEGRGAAIAATGAAINVQGMSRMRIKDGKVVEEWVSWDEASAMAAVGNPGARASYTGKPS